MIGTPNAGSPLADFVAHSSLPAPAKSGNPFAILTMSTGY